MALSKRGAVADNRSSSVTTREVARRSPARMRAIRRSRSARSSARGVCFGRAMPQPDSGPWVGAQWQELSCPGACQDGSARRGRPPCFEIETAEGFTVGEAQIMPMGDPHLRQIEKWDHVVARDEYAVEGTHGGREVLGRARLQQGLDHGIGRRVLDARIIERALDVGSLAAPAVDLLVAG